MQRMPDQVLPAQSGLKLNVDQAATRAGVSKRTIFYWLAKGKIDCVRSPRLRIIASTLPERQKPLQ
jgi:predicted site-specific integrase-resolvase